MVIQKNIVLQSAHHRPFLADVFYVDDYHKKPVVILCHGFQGFKDWGAYDLVAKAFAEAGFIFIKFNFSHNGTTVDQPTDFVDTEAFGNNNFSIELDDLGTVIDWICADNFPVHEEQVGKDEIYLIGHSRGGGIVMLRAGEDERVKKIATWASINEFGKFFQLADMEKVKKDGVIYIYNSRTQQRLPLYWQLYENYLNNHERLYIPDVVRRLKIPMLIGHGSADETVPYSIAKELQAWNPDAKLVTIEKGNHVFGAKHPWPYDYLPADLDKAVKATIDFFKS